jgi:hypothetical protein
MVLGRVVNLKRVVRPADRGMQWNDAISSIGPRLGSKSCTDVQGSPRAILTVSCVKSTGPWTNVDPMKVGSAR